jgi:hypothetical protein
MIDDLQTAVIRSLRISREALLGLEAISRERWRVWTLDAESEPPTLQLFLFSLRSQSSEPAFDAQFLLTLAWYRSVGEADPARLPFQVWQFVLDYFLQQNARRPAQAWWSELPEPRCAWCDAADRLWAVRVEVDRVEQPLPLSVVWLHDQVLFLAVAWGEAVLRLLALAQDAQPLSPFCEKQASFPLA